MSSTATIIDRGRGPQLSTSRITVQDVVPYLQQELTHEQIRKIMPVLSEDDLQAVEQYVRENYDAVMEQDRRIREQAAQRKASPETEIIVQRGGAKMEELRQAFQRAKPHHPERNGDLPRR